MTRYRSRRSLEYYDDFSDVDVSCFGKKAIVRALDHGSHSVNGGCGGRNGKQDRRLLHLKLADDTVYSGKVFTPRQKQAAVTIEETNARMQCILLMCRRKEILK